MKPLWVFYKIKRPLIRFNVLVFESFVINLSLAKFA
mgnify:CR=1 FL=1